MIVSVLLNGLWQGALIVAIAYLLSRAVSKRDAATRYAVWLTTLIALVVIPVLTTLSSAGALLLEAFAAHSNRMGYTVSLVPAGALVHHADAWFERSAAWFLCAWLGGVALNLIRLGCGLAAIDRIRRHARRLEGAESNVLVSADVSVPVVIGVFLPAIVIPQSLLGALTPLDLQRIVRHERAHVCRRDAFFNLIQRFVQAWLFFNPWVHLAARHLCTEREAACDDRVVEEMGNPDAYASCLATVARFALARKPPLLTPGAFGSRRALAARIERLNAGARRPLTANALTIGGTIVLFIATTLALQAFAPALGLPPAAAGIGIPSTASAVAAACSHPNSEASVITAAPPELPHGVRLKGEAVVAVTIAPNGRVLHASVLHSSGNAAIDNAVMEAARKTTYAPKRANCAPVEGRYLFHADLQPSA